MLFRLDNPRLVMNAQEFPENMVLYCLAYANCAGDVVANFVELQTNRLGTLPIQPTRSLGVFEGVTLNEYVIPFEQLVDPLGRRGSTFGFTIIGRSSYRVAGADYQTRTLEFTMIFPVIGGGIIRLRTGEQEWEIANPTFNPQAGTPPISTLYGVGIGNEYVSGPTGIENQRVPDDILINAYQRTHRGFIGQAASEIERRRQERLANFDLNEEVNLPSMGTSVAIDTAEQRRPNRLGQIRRTEQGRLGPLIIGVDSGTRETPNVGIVTPATIPPKTPPKTRFQRVQENCEKANEPKK
jgi:hypothetical protein